MAFDFRAVRVYFQPVAGREQSEQSDVVFAGRVNRAEAVINGFDVKFTDGNRPFYRQKIDIRVTRIIDRVVFIQAEYLLRDTSGNIDDRYDGYVDVVVFADVT